MTLAQVVYQMSTDQDFAAHMRMDPDAALAEKGMQLSKEEQAFLSRGLVRASRSDGSQVRLADMTALIKGWA
jgi:hypothetical protein